MDVTLSADEVKLPTPAPVPELPKEFPEDLPVRLAVFCPDRNDGTAWYRAIGPLRECERQFPWLTLKFVDNVSWSSIWDADIVFLQRPFGPPGLEAARNVITCGRRLWVDWDDNVMNVPPHNPAFRLFANTDPRILAEIAGIARAVTTTTSYMQGLYQRLSQHVHVIPNGISKKYLCDTVNVVRTSDNNSELSRRTTVLWRGSPGHDESLREYGVVIERLAAKYPDVVWVWKGYTPYYYQRFLTPKNCVFLPWEPIPSCFLNQCSVAPDIALVLLQNNAFDRGRSPTAWLEGSVAGAVTVAPDFGHWKTAGVFNYSASVLESLETALEKAIQASRLQRRQMNTLARKQIDEEYTWEALAPMYRRLLQKLIRERVRISLDVMSLPK